MPTESSPPAASARSLPTLLLVDPDASRRQDLVARFAQSGAPWAISCASTLVAATDLLRAQNFSAIWAYTLLPDGNLLALADSLATQAMVLVFEAHSSDATTPLARAAANTLAPGVGGDEDVKSGLVGDPMVQALQAGFSHCIRQGSHPFSVAEVTQRLHLAQRQAAQLTRMSRLTEAVNVLERVSDMASVGGWLFNAQSREVLWTPVTRRIHGVSDQFIPTPENVSDFYAPDARAQVKADIERLNRQSVPWRLDFELRTQDGRHAWIMVRGQVQRQPGKPTLIWGTVQDITDQKNTELELQNTSALLAQNTQDLRITLDTISQGIVRVDRDGTIKVVNQQALEMLEIPPEMLNTVTTLQEVMQFQIQRGDFGAGYEWVEQRAIEHLTLGDVDSSPKRYVRATRSGTTLEVTTRSLPGGGMVRTFSDISAHANAQRALQNSETRFRSLTELSSDWYWEQDADLRFVPVEGSALRVAGLVMPTLVGRRFWEIATLNMKEAGWDSVRADQAQHQVFRDLELHMGDLTGLAFWMSISGTPVFDDQRNFLGYRGVGRNITERKRTQRRIEQLAFYDALTGLPNRRMLTDRLKVSLASTLRRKHCGALLFIDLDNFKTLNDTLGHAMGDELLRQVGDRLKDCVREIDTVARFGGDEFVVMLEELQGNPDLAAAQAETVAKKILTALNHAFELVGRQHHTSPSIGITLIGEQVLSVDETLKRADLAMYQAKAAGRNTLRFFDPDMQAATIARAAMESDLRQAVHREQLQLHYQVVVNRDGRVTGVEGLLRWFHPLRGQVLPGMFIDLAEQTGLILQLGQWVLETACKQLVAWNDAPATRALSIAVNVSARQFKQPDFADDILALLRATGANPYRLKLELTESLLLVDIEDAIKKMSALRAIGVSFALDDFGTGYSSLSYLKRLPLDQLKIDQSFVRDVLTDPNDAAIARTILTLAHSLELAVVAEGVETEGQRNFLLNSGCKAFQGHLFGPPMPIDKLNLAARGV